MNHNVSYVKRKCDDTEKIEGLLRSARTGVLGLVDGTEPYAIPVNFVWFEGSVYFHGMGSGRKTELLAKAPAACFTVYRENGTVSDPVPCHADTSYLSVMIFGKAERVGDSALAATALQSFIDKFAPGKYPSAMNPSLLEKYRSGMDGNSVAVYRIITERMTAKENDCPPDV